MRAIFLITIFLINLLFSIYPLTCYATTPNLFPTQTEAQQHCPSDEVVWLNLSSKVWHVQGSVWFGKTKYGAYACKQEAFASGYSPPKIEKPQQHLQTCL